MKPFKKCRHDKLRGIYGDEVNQLGGKRSECLECHALFDELPNTRIGDENTSDGYHTFKELYDHRIALYIALMRANPGISWKSERHADGSKWDGWFIAGMTLPTGAITYHLPISDWKYLRRTVKTLDRAPEWDGHTPADVVQRLLAWEQNKPGLDFYKQIGRKP